jgi:hypothetical protein
MVSNPHIEIVQIADLTTYAVAKVSRVSNDSLSESIMVARLQAYSHLEPSINFTYFCDADSIFISTPKLSPRLVSYYVDELKTSGSTPITRSTTRNLKERL